MNYQPDLTDPICVHKLPTLTDKSLKQLEKFKSLGDIDEGTYNFLAFGAEGTDKNALPEDYKIRQEREDTWNTLEQ